MIYTVEISLHNTGILLNDTHLIKECKDFYLVKNSQGYQFCLPFQIEMIKEDKEVEKDEEKLEAYLVSNDIYFTKDYHFDLEDLSKTVTFCLQITGKVAKGILVDLTSKADRIKKKRKKIEI